MLAGLGIAILIYVAVAGAMFLGQRRLLFTPDTERPDVAHAETPGLREVVLHTADGLDLLGWWLPPARPDAPVLVYFHGNAGTLANRIPRMRFFAALGWGMLMPEYRGYGGNPGAPSEAGFALDAAAGMAFLAREGVPLSRIVAYGESIGTGVAVQVAAGSAVAGLVLESPYTSITDIARARFWFLPVGLLLRDRFDSLARIGTVHVPLLVLQGGQDVVVPPALGQTLFAAASEPKQIWVSPAAGHGNLMQFGAGDVTADFVRRVVQ